MCPESRHSGACLVPRRERRVDSTEEITLAEPHKIWLRVICFRELREALVYLGLRASLTYTSYVTYRIALHKIERPLADGGRNLRRQEAVLLLREHIEWEFVRRVECTFLSQGERGK